MSKNQTFGSRFFRMESAGGICLMLAAVAAVIAANFSFKSFYDYFLSTPVEVRVG